MSLLDAAAGLPNATLPRPTVLVGGQPVADHLKRLRDAGLAIVLDVRDPMEPRPMDEPAVVRDLGMEYVNIPVTAGHVTDQVLERILEVLRGAGERPVLFHCASGNRTGAGVIAHLMLDHGVEEDEAVAAAMRGGLRSAEILEWGLDYVQRARE